MAAPRYLDIGGRRYLWRDIMELRRSQRKATRELAQPTLFELKDDRRPTGESTAAGRYQEPTLFTLLEDTHA